MRALLTRTQVTALPLTSLFLLVAGCGSGFGGDGATSSSAAVTEKCGASAGGAVQGVDVSDYQGNFDWAHAGVQFGYAQVSDGLYSPQWSFDGNWSRMKAAGVLRGAYQFFQPAQDPTAQANMVVAKVGKLGPGDLPAMIDVEVTGGLSGSEIGSRVRTWLEVVEKGTGLKPVIYTGSYFWEDNVGTNLSSYPIWIAAYGPACPSLPSDGWSNWMFWQYSDGGGGLDHDVFNGTLAQLKALGGGGSAAPTAPENPWGSRVARNTDGRLEVFARGADDAIWHAWQTTPGGTWSDFASLGGKVAGEPVVVQNEDGRLEAFAFATDGSITHVWQHTPGGTWSDTSSLGGTAAGSPAVALNTDGRLEVFVRGSGDAVYHNWQTTKGGSWAGWASMDGVVISAPAVGRNKDGRLEVFARGTDNAIWHKWQTTAGGSWSGWATMHGSEANDPTVAQNLDGRLEVFTLSPTGGVDHIWQETAGGSWSTWSSMGGSLTGDVSVGLNEDGRLEVFGRAADDSIWHDWQKAPHEGWNGWSNLGGSGLGDPAVASNHDGRLEVFVLASGGLDHRWQAKAGGSWNTTGWSNMGGKLQ